MWIFGACLVAAVLVYTYTPAKKTEGFENKELRVYTLPELACALQVIKTYLEKDGDPIYLIEVRDVAFYSVGGMTIVCTVFNKRTFTTKMYKATIESGKVTRMTDNVIEFKESFLEHTLFGKPMGIHESEQLHKIPFMTSDISQLSRYTFSKMQPPEDGNGNDLRDVALATYAQHKMQKEDARVRVANMLSNPEMRKYMTIQSLRNQ